MKRILVLAAMVLASGAAIAQSKPGDYDSNDAMMAKAKVLLQKAQTNDTGFEVEVLKNYGNHFTELVARSKSGQGELHSHWVDIFFILDGEGTVTTGGKMVNPVSKPRSSSAEGEQLADKIDGGTSQVLKKGDVFHVPAATPHQMTVAPGKTVVYYVVKVQSDK